MPEGYVSYLEKYHVVTPDPITEKVIEEQEVMENFLERLKMTIRDLEKVGGVGTNEWGGVMVAWEKIEKEGLTRESLRGFLDNIGRFNPEELMKIIFSIDDLLKKWDSSYGSFLRALKNELTTLYNSK